MSGFSGWISLALIFLKDTRFKEEEFEGSILQFKPFVFSNGTVPFLLDQNTKLDSKVVGGISSRIPQSSSR